MATLDIRTQTYRTHKPFTISRGSKSAAEQVIVTISNEGFSGFGACVPYGRYGETIASVRETIETHRDRIEQAPFDMWAEDTIPNGAAGNAIDCALWDLKSQLERSPVWALASIPQPSPKPTATTLTIDTPAIIGLEAKGLRERALLKVKLAGDGHDRARLDAIFDNAPEVKLILDANEALDRLSLDGLSQIISSDRVYLMEQPLPAGEDSALSGYDYKDKLCADESFHGVTDISKLAELYGAVNIKLDKTAGFTNALTSIRAAKKAGLRVMLGCMLGSSLAMAPAFMLSGLVDILDLDGPLLLKDDDPQGFQFDTGIMHPSNIWGIPRTL